jgi:IS30 family transposase
MWRELKTSSIEPLLRPDVVVDFTPPLERLDVREFSKRFLSQEERIEIADLQPVDLIIRQVAARLGRAPSTVSRELYRNASVVAGICG